MSSSVDTAAGWTVWQDGEIAGRFASQRRGGIPGAAEQFETLLRLIAYVPARPLEVLDVGCGDGVVLETVAGAYPVARGVGVDGSAAMLQRARDRVVQGTSFGASVTLLQADFTEFGWLDRLPVRTFDCVVSAFAIHHCEPERQRALYGEIVGLLRPGGVFVNIEHVASLGAHGEELFEAAYADRLVAYRQSRGETAELAQVAEELRTRPDKAANRLVPVESHLRWLREMGLTDVDCYWKWFELAVLAGYKPRER